MSLEIEQVCQMLNAQWHQVKNMDLVNGYTLLYYMF